MMGGRVEPPECPPPPWPRRRRWPRPAGFTVTPGPTRLVLVVTLMGVMAGTAWSADTAIDGRISFRGLFSADDGPQSPTVGIAFLETDARAEDLTSRGLRLVLDGTFVLDGTQANERRFGATESLQQTRQLYLELPGVKGKLDVALGRRLIAEAGNAWVDGIDAEMHVSKQLSVGVFGGLRPDPIDYSPTVEAQAAGLYTHYTTSTVDAAVGYSAVFRGGLDRQVGFNRIHVRATDELALSSYMVVDFLDNPQITTLLASVDYTPIESLNLTLNISRYSLERYRDQTIYRNVIEPNQVLLLGNEILELVYNRARLSASLRFWERFFHYQMAEFKVRSQDGAEGWAYTIGLRNESVWGTGVEADVRATVRDNFASDTFLLGLVFQYDVRPGVTVAGRLTLFDGRTLDRDSERSRAFDEAQRVVLFGGTGTWRASQHHHLDVNYDGIYEAELQDARNQENLLVHTAMLRYSFLF